MEFKIDSTNPATIVKIPMEATMVELGFDRVDYMVKGRRITVAVVDTTEHEIRICKKSKKK